MHGGKDGAFPNQDLVFTTFVSVLVFVGTKHSISYTSFQRAASLFEKLKCELILQNANCNIMT